MSIDKYVKIKEIVQMLKVADTSVIILVWETLLRLSDPYVISHDSVNFNIK